MNAIPLINNAPRPNINVGSIGSPAFNPVAAGAKLGGSIGGNVMRQNPASMPVNNEAQLRQEINTSLVALKKEAFSLETLIAQAVKTLTDINSRIEALEGKQGDYVKKADATVESVGGDGKYISAISETDGKINATATDLGNMVPVNSVTSGNMHSVTSNAVYSALQNKAPLTSGVYYIQLTPRQLNTAETITGIVKNLYDQGYRFIVFGVGWEEYETQENPGSAGYFLLAETSAVGVGFLRQYNNPNYTYSCRWLDNIRVDRFSGWQII